MRYNCGWRAPAHCGVTNLVRSGTKQPQSFPVSAADQARLFSPLSQFKFEYVQYISVNFFLLFFFFAIILYMPVLLLDLPDAVLCTVT